MRKTISVLFFAIISLSHIAVMASEPVLKNSGVYFTENKGQVSDQNNKPRPDVLFAGTVKDLTFHLRKKGVSYQFNKVVSFKKTNNNVSVTGSQIIDTMMVYRLDLDWLNTNTDVRIKKESARAGFDNFYLEKCPDGILGVNSYQEITYQHLYNGIDLKWYEKNGQLKYDYIVDAGVDYSQIQIKINGAESVRINQNGDLVLKTPLGEVIEKAPVVFQDHGTLRSKWLIKKNIVSFEIENLDKTKSFIIDPLIVTRTMGTFYGGTNFDKGNACTTDRFGNVYLAGQTSSSSFIATTGAFQSSQVASADAFITKFNNNGSRLWGTYYGTSTNDYGYGCSADSVGNIYMVGQTDGTGTNLSTPGSFKTTSSGGLETFLVKFNPAGARIWGTYYGGTANDYGQFCATKGDRAVFFGGYTNSTTNISTVGSHQPALSSGNDAFLVKFDSAGVRQWATYYGGTGAEFGNACCVDSTGNVFIGGNTVSSTNIGSPGSHQPTRSNGSDAFLAKFNFNGVRQWATYYGGSGNETGNSVAVDRDGNVFMCGQSNSSSSGTIIATVGSHQASIIGTSNTDYLAKFNSFGIRQWGTYYGAAAPTATNACITDSLNNIYLTGVTLSAPQIPTPGAFQPFYGGGNDAYFAVFNSAGQRQYGSYYGYTGAEQVFSCAVGKGGKFYITGQTNSAISGAPSALVTTGAHQINYSGNTDAFLAEFYLCLTPDAPVNVTPPSFQNICINNAATLYATGTGTLSWFANATTTTALATGLAFTSPTLGPGIYTYYVESLTCLRSESRTAITVTVSPFLNVSSGVICEGQSFSLMPTGADSYTITGGQAVVSPTSTTSYSVTGSTLTGCVSSAPVVANVTVNPVPVITVNSGTICEGQSFNINPSGATTYNITGGSTVVSPLVSTTYMVSGTNTQGCVSPTPAISSVVVNPLPILIPNNGSICPGGTFTIMAFGSPTYNISGGNAVVSPTVTTSYNLNTTNSFGCFASAVSQVKVFLTPTFIISSSASYVCLGYTASLFAGGAAGSFVWNDGSTSNPLVVNPITTTAYTVTGTDLNTCKSTATFTQNITSCAGLKTFDLTNSQVKVYPNPNNGNFIVELDGAASVKIYTSTGQLVYAQKTANLISEVSIDKYACGIYFLISETEERTSIIKIIKTE